MNYMALIMNKEINEPFIQYPLHTYYVLGMSKI